jgi:phosphohistidine phosphatase SixA
MKITFSAQHFQRSNCFHLITISCLILLLSVEGGGARAVACVTEDEFKVTTVYLVRHAEKAASPAADPPLLEAGTKRAEELARKLGKSGIKTIYISQYQRTKLTAEPLARQLGISSTEIPVRMSATSPRELSPQYLTEMAERISSGGGNVLVVGHNNTVPAIIKALGGDISMPLIDETVFDDLFVVTVYTKGKATVAHLKQ